MSASAIVDGLVTMLCSASAFGAGMATKDYGVLERASGSCCVVSWTGLGSRQAAFGRGNKERTWTLVVEAFAKDRGSPSATMDRLFAIDTVIGALDDDDTLQGTVEEITEVRASRDVGEALSVGGATWLPMRIEIDATEWTV